MSEFATWARDPWWLPTEDIPRATLLRDALNLCAQQHDTLVQVVVSKEGGAEVKMDAIRAAEAFKERYD